MDLVSIAILLVILIVVGIGGNYLITRFATDAGLAKILRLVLYAILLIVFFVRIVLPLLGGIDLRV